MIDYEKLEIELRNLVNIFSIDNECNMPDFILSNLICKIILSLVDSNDLNKEWHCD